MKAALVTIGSYKLCVNAHCTNLCVYVVCQWITGIGRMTNIHHKWKTKQIATRIFTFFFTEHWLYRMFQFAKAKHHVHSSRANAKKRKTKKILCRLHFHLSNIDINKCLWLCERAREKVKQRILLSIPNININNCLSLYAQLLAIVLRSVCMCEVNSCHKHKQNM